MKTYFKISSWFGAAVAAALYLGLASSAYAMTPTLALTATGSGDNVQIDVHGDPGASVLLYYTKTNVGSQVTSIGNISSSGTMSLTVSTATYGVAQNSTVYVTTGGLSGPQSASVVWPNTAPNSGNLTLSQTGISIASGQTANVTVQNNSANTVYLSNNSNPPIVNVNINGNQLTIVALSNGSTTITVCAQGSTTSCASAYVTVQNSGAQALTFGMNNVTVAQGQNLPITISGGNGAYQIVTNSNSAAIQANISGSTITLTTNSAAGVTAAASAITVCSTDMASCGIINATVGSSSTQPLVFNPSNPSVGVGQTTNVIISGGAGINPTYTVTSNSSTNVIQATVNGNGLSLYGNNNGTATITVCSSGGSCGNLTVTVNYVSTGGSLQLSQSLVSLLVGQVMSVTISGGTSPYTLSGNSGNYYQASVNGNIITLSGLAAGSSNLNVCSSGGACLNLAVTVNASGAGVALGFSQSNVSLTVGGATAVGLTGSGGYYVGSSSNQGVAVAQISGNTAIITAQGPGSTNISICQSGGQCSILFVSVAVNGSGQTANVPSFSQLNPSLAIGQTVTETITGGTGSSYYVLANTNPTAVQLALNNSQLVLTGLSSGVSTVVVCAAANSCALLNASVTTQQASQNITLSQTSLNLAPGQSATLTVTGNGSYFQSGNSNPAAATAQINASTVTVNALAAGSTIISICQTASQCAGLTVTVAAPSSLTVPTSPTTPPPVAPTTKFIFKTQLQTGSLNNDVTELQKRLTSEGVYNGPVTGKFGAQTRAAVKLYQKNHGIRQTGILGPLTMAELNK